ncbi:hypothetical protein EDC04DRAFT_3091849 [Pisolithus marmoratus]|nr:hypothetical protein EDC04DRAFT_3091849 [Pisolithus marmoratus]
MAMAYDTLGEDGLMHSLNKLYCVSVFTNADLFPLLAHVVRNTPSVSMKTGYGHVKMLMDVSIQNCKGDLITFQPTTMVGVPAIWEAIQKGIIAKCDERSSEALVAYYIVQCSVVAQEKSLFSYIVTPSKGFIGTYLVACDWIMGVRSMREEGDWAESLLMHLTVARLLG